MAADYRELLKDQVVIVALRKAWEDSQLGVAGGHEEGGTADVFKDEIAMLTANVMAVANKRAHEGGVDVLNSLIIMTLYLQDGTIFWRINYGPKDYISRRGGDLIIDVDAVGKIERMLQGQ